MAQAINAKDKAGALLNAVKAVKEQALVRVSPRTLRSRPGIGTELEDIEYRVMRSQGTGTGQRVDGRDPDTHPSHHDRDRFRPTHGSVRRGYAFGLAFRERKQPPERGQPARMASQSEAGLALFQSEILPGGWSPSRRGAADADLGSGLFQPQHGFVPLTESGPEKLPGSVVDPRGEQRLFSVEGE